MTLLVCESLKCETHKLRDSQAWQYIALFPFCETRETRETRTDIFARSESHFPQNSREKNCETRLAVNPTCETGPGSKDVLECRRPSSLAQVFLSLYLDPNVACWCLCSVAPTIDKGAGGSKSVKVNRLTCWRINVKARSAVFYLLSTALLATCLPLCPPSWCFFVFRVTGFTLFHPNLNLALRVYNPLLSMFWQNCSSGCPSANLHCKNWIHYVTP